MPAYSSRYTQSEASSPPPPPDRGRRASARQRRPRPRGYSGPREKPRRDVTIIMCVYQQRSHNWHSIPLSFDPYRTTDEELWSQIRDIYRTDLQPAYKRLLGFKKLKYILPRRCVRRFLLIERQIHCADRGKSLPFILLKPITKSCAVKLDTRILCTMYNA